ncbi:MAG: HEAT repeat domain-containing protein, partial [Desulfovibrionaceae bacterium]
MDLRFDGKDSTDIRIEPTGPSAEHAILNFKNILASPGESAAPQAAKAMVRAAAGVRDAEPEDRPPLQGVLSNLIYALLLREQSGSWPAPHIKALLGLGDAGRRIVLRGLSRGQVLAKALHRSLEGCSILDQVRLLNMVLLRPRGMDPELTAMVWERMNRLLRSHPDECLTLLEELARQGRTLAYPVQKAIMDSAFWVWIKQVLREKLEDEHLAYLSRAMSRLQSEECAHELARMLGRCGPEALPEVLNALAQTGARRDPRLIEAVHGLCCHKNRDVRIGALSALIELGDPGAPKGLAKLAAKSPDDVEVLLMACRLDRAGFKPMLSELPGAARREMVARMLSLLSQLKPRALADAARLLAGENHPQAEAAVAEFILAHRERRPPPVRRTAEDELPLYASPPEPAAPDGGQDASRKLAAKSACLAEILKSGAQIRGG